MSDDEYPLGEWVYPTPEELAAAREAYRKRLLALADAGNANSAASHRLRKAAA